MALESLAITANGTYPSSGGLVIRPTGIDGAVVTVHVYGTWDSATVTLQHGLDGTNFDDVDEDGTPMARTADGHMQIRARGGYIQLVVTGVVTAASLTADVAGAKTP